ncbi:MAG: FAD-binding oxidoreductase [Colwellia sp.]|nr:FAD-binding oxidoreductase [Colwellia sp.]MCW8865466.1 FAD-binding oxidoreductase [Colwellia sp.]MCW9080456.1 FAD-binding oxidoreductase [Colwellia sp.]
MNLNLDASSAEAFNTQKVVVIGAGIVGVNCALALQILGYQVTLLDKQGIGEGCSKGNAGHFATEQVFPLAEPALLMQLPKMLLDPLGPVALSAKHFFKAIPWFLQFFNNMRADKRANNSTALQALNKQAIEHYKPLLQAANAQHLLVSKGSLLVFENTAYKDVLAMHSHYQGAGIAVELLDREQALALEPNLHDNIHHALFFTEVGHTGDPLAICTALAEYAKSLGMEFKQAAVDSIRQSESKVVINMEQDSLCFDHCVVATGAWSKNLLKDLGYHLPIEAERGYSFSIPLAETESPLLSRPVASAERKFIITPMEKILRLSGTVEYAGLHTKANNKRADMLLKNAECVLDKLPEQVLKNDEDNAERWMGCRPSLPDSLPVICQAPAHNKIFFALGHQHLGLTQGAVTGKLIGQLVQGQPTDIDMSPYCISRFN